MFVTLLWPFLCVDAVAMVEKIRQQERLLLDNKNRRSHCLLDVRKHTFVIRNSVKNGSDVASMEFLIGSASRAHAVIQTEVEFLRFRKMLQGWSVRILKFDGIGDVKSI
jgi:hypothetical protein